MLISHTHSFIFIHVAKVAGISIRNALSPYASEPDFFKIKRPVREINGKPNKFYEIWDSVLVHATAAQVQIEMPEFFDKYHKFAFVRNPWDWQVSMYHFLLKQSDYLNDKTVKQLSSFESYLDWVTQSDKPFPKGATKLQKTMLTDENDKLLVDHVGRFESLASDFNQNCKLLNIEASLPNLNTSQHKKYQNYYNDYTRKIVNKISEEDIDYFKYTF